MFRKYKEIVFGICFGIAALMIDTALDGKAEGASFAEEIAAHPGMMVYRIGFLVLGLALGWLLWRNNKREREVRLLTVTLQSFQQQCAARCLLLCSTLQILLTRSDLHLSDQAQQMVGDAYQKSQELQRFVEEKLPIPRL